MTGESLNAAIQSAGILDEFCDKAVLERIVLDKVNILGSVRFSDLDPLVFTADLIDIGDLVSLENTLANLSFGELSSRLMPKLEVK